ncbi:isochorismatase family protein [Roseateles sp.]|uniref:isochorismatase family protein n=1 Tax=Roseateles sp. TaxID=1971397 RepID=UPI003BA46386
MTSAHRRQFITTAALSSGLGLAAASASASTTASTSPSRKSPNAAPMPKTVDHRSFKTDNTALILVDHQVGTIGWAGELAHEAEREQLKMWVRVMARFAKSAGMPVVLTSSLETEAQGPLLPEFKSILPKEYEQRIQRTGVINAWEDPAFAKAVRATGKKNLLMAGLTTDVCLVPPALSAAEEGFNVVALLDISAACTKMAGQNSREILQRHGIDIMSVTPMITSMLGNYKNPASAGFFEAFGAEGVYQAFAKGNLR